MVTALYWPESSQIIQKHVEDFEGFVMVRVNHNSATQRLIGLKNSIQYMYMYLPPLLVITSGRTECHTSPEPD